MKRILVVEDDVIICGGVKLFLEKMGYEVETAYSCKEADGLSGTWLRSDIA